MFWAPCGGHSLLGIYDRYGKFTMHFLLRWQSARRLRSLCAAVGWSKHPRGIFQTCGAAAKDGSRSDPLQCNASYHMYIVLRLHAIHVLYAVHHNTIYKMKFHGI